MRYENNEFYKGFIIDCVTNDNEIIVTVSFKLKITVYVVNIT